MIMEDAVLFTWLNDYVFCPRSIYFHNLYGEKERLGLSHHLFMQISVLMEGFGVSKELFDA